MPAAPPTARRAVWQQLYTQRLPALARARDPAQPTWPVQLDHCFGRIILDKVVGRGRRAWTEVIKGPAIRTMSDGQVEECIGLGERIASGEVDLVALDRESLRARGKREKGEKGEKGVAKGSGRDGGAGTKRKRGEERERERAKAGDGQGRDEGGESGRNREEDGGEARGDEVEDYARNSGEDERLAAKARRTDDLEEERQLIENSSLAEYQKKVLLALCQVPRGKFTTYAEISRFLSSSPRAVGNAMRNNPFAPAVPCHRVLAADGKIGGYGGEWGEGPLVTSKRKLLREEGLKFDGKGKVVGGPFKAFK